MELPTVFGWVVLLVLGMLVKSLSGKEYGWALIAAAVFVLGTATMGYTYGMIAGRDGAAPIFDRVEKGCAAAFQPGVGPVIPVDGRRQVQWQGRLDLLEVKPNRVIGLAAVCALFCSFLYLLLQVQTVLAELKRLKVLAPQPANQQNEDRPEERDGRDG
ncbi:hypothetical protein [Xanthomonas sacchari]|uniref:hypothetical protein n=1 Tax=Xanthomonas sacchari TaxID=56458 RepID=UPI00224F92B2|nr:hypothetical protein [Xanthomonas sacchari]MCW0447233.1 hypothetical protein [Xanthomonas sacchari]